MRGLDKDHPEQDFEIQMPDTGEGLIVSFDHQGFTTGVLYAIKQGWEVDPDSSETVQIGYIHQVRVYDKEKMNEFKKLEEGNNADESTSENEETEIADTPTEAVEASTDAKSSTESEKGVDFEELASLPNTKENRTKIDNMAKDEFGIEIDRRKFKTVKAIVKEFEQAYSGL